MKTLSVVLFSTILLTSPAQAQVEAGIGVIPTAVAEVPEITDPDPIEILTKGVDPALVRSEDGLVIWPIPVVKELNIYCGGESHGNLPFEIVDITGRVKVRGSIVGGKVNLIEVESLAKGDHVLRVVDGRSVRSIAFQTNRN